MVILDWAVANDIGFSAIVSLGDAADIDFGDLLDYLAQDPHTSSILLYVEGVRGSGEMGRSQEQIYELAERNLYELEKEKQQLEIQIKTLLKLKSKELMEYAAGLQLPQNGVTVLLAHHHIQARI